MDRIALLARATLRARWAGLVLTGVLAGVIGGALLVSVTVARRTSTAWERLADATHMEDVRVLSQLGPDATKQLTQLPEISQAWVGHGMLGKIEGESKQYMSLSTGPPRDPHLDRPLVVEGRAANPDAVDELTIDEQLQKLRGIHLGDQITLDFLTQRQFLQFDSGFGEPAGPRATFHIVGVTREPAPEGGLAPVEATPAFSRRYATPDLRIDLLRARLHGGTSSLAKFQKDVAALGNQVKARMADDPDIKEIEAFPVSIPSEAGGPVASTARVLVTGLIVATVIAALAGGTAVVQVMIRRHASDDERRRVESALGLTFPDQLRVRLLTGTLAAAVATLTAFGIALAGSSLGPLGSIAAYEPHPGPAPHLGVLLIGGLAVFGLVLALDAFAFFVVVRSSRKHRRVTKRLTVAAAAAGASPAVDVGVELAFDRRANRAAIAVRSARIGAVIGTAGVVATIVFAASLTRLSTTPTRWGWQSDVEVVDSRPPVVDAVLRDRRVTALADGDTSAVRLAGDEVVANSLTVRRGQLGWTMLDGREPSSPDEVALGTRLAADLGLGVGDSVKAAVPSGGSRRLSVVGVGIGPRGGGYGPFAGSALLTDKGLKEMQVRDPYHSAYVKVRPGTLDAFMAHWGKDLELATPDRPSEITNLADLGVLPAALGIFLGVVAVAALTSALVVAVQQRRRDLGTLRAMGMSRGDVRRAISVAGVSIAAVGVVIGMPLGMVVGGNLWRLVASGVHVQGDAAFTWPLLLVPIVALGLGALVSLVPGERAVRHNPAWLLRAE